MKYFILLILLGLTPTVHGQDAGVPAMSAFQHVKGSDKALARLDLLFENLGGRSLWANAKSLQVIQRTRSPRIGDGILTLSWHDLEAPGEWVDIQHARLNARYAWSAEAGWLRKGDKYRDYIDDEIAEKVFYWERNLYTLYHRLASDQPGYSVELLKPHGLLVRNPEFEKVAEFHLTAEGELYRWQQLGTQKKSSSIFGSYKSFGALNYPDWVAAADGTWSAYQIHVMPSELPFREQVSLKKPVREWHGGAVKNNCEP